MPESDNITLVTADEPPQRYLVSRSRLTVLSGVFRDLLSTPTTAEDEMKREIALTEQAHELKGLMMVLQDEEKFATLDRPEWITLARMGDKYDCKAATKEVLTRTWQLVADGEEHQTAFFLAATLDHRKLIQRLCSEAIDKKWYQWDCCPQPLKAHLEKSRQLRFAQVQAGLLKEVPLKMLSCGVDCAYSHDALEAAWNDAACHVMRNYQVSETVEEQRRKRLERDSNDLDSCSECIYCMREQGRKIDSELPLKLRIVQEVIDLRRKTE